MRKATLKASVQPLAPKLAATSGSRARPVMREASVNRETVEAARSRFMEGGRGLGQTAIIGSAHGHTADGRLAPMLYSRLHSRTASYSMATSSKAKKKTVRIASGRKRARQDVKLNAANTALRSKFRTVIKNVQKAVPPATRPRRPSCSSPPRA